METLFFLLLATVCYTYLGYPVVLKVLTRLFGSPGETSRTLEEHALPRVTLVIPAYNEQGHAIQKVFNNFTLDYPEDKIDFVFVTDGSTDDTVELVDHHLFTKVMHNQDRRGKVHAVNRVMKEINTPITIFTDANTMLNKEAIRNMVRHFADEKVGVVAGEKKIISPQSDEAAGAGEGLYWKYESTLKKWDAQLYSTVGAAGELFAIRTELYRPVAPDIVIEDFVMTMGIVNRGYRIAYEPEAFAQEHPSFSVKEEFKRKIRISAGAFQAMARLPELLNPMRNSWLSFQYLSHRVFRWTLAPLALVLLPFVNAALVHQHWFYQLTMAGQLFFYGAAFLGFCCQHLQIKAKWLHVPFYFIMMNVSVIAGFRNYLLGNQSVVWSKAMRRA